MFYVQHCWKTLIDTPSRADHDIQKQANKNKFNILFPFRNYHKRQNILKYTQFETYFRIANMFQSKAIGILALLTVIDFGSVSGGGSAGGTAGSQIRRIWIEDYCTSGICMGLTIAKQDFVIFSQLPIKRVTSLTFLNSTIAKIPHLLFDSFPDLEILKIINCSMEMFEKPQFEGASYLMALDLGHNKISEIPRNIFLGADNLRTLSLEFNEIVNIHNQSFQALKELQSLTLEGNHLEFITTTMFASLRKLEALNLSRNKLSTLPVGVFNKNTHVTQLKVGFNLLKSVDPAVYRTLTKLKTIDYSGNIMPHVVLNFSRLENFVAADCEIMKLDVFGIVHGINLRNNSLQFIPSFPESGNLTNLDISSNPLAKIDTNTFRKFTGLKRLNLSGSNLHELPDGVFKKQSLLEYLDISDNSLFTVPVSIFDNLKSLETFYFHQNNWNCDFLEHLMNSFVKRGEIIFQEDTIAPELVDDFRDGIACWYESNGYTYRISKKFGVATNPRGGMDGGFSRAGGSCDDSVIELAIVRNDIKHFFEVIEKKLIKLSKTLDEIKIRI